MAPLPARSLLIGILHCFIAVYTEFGIDPLLMVDELKDITFSLSIQLIYAALLESICELFQPTEKQISLLTQNFVSRLPQRYQVLLKAD